MILSIKFFIIGTLFFSQQKNDTLVYINHVNGKEIKVEKLFFKELHLSTNLQLKTSIESFSITFYGDGGEFTWKYKNGRYYSGSHLRKEKQLTKIIENSTKGIFFYDFVIIVNNQKRSIDQLISFRLQRQRED